jgi:hypothetical protein
MKRLGITIVILLMVFSMACKESSETPAPKDPGSSSGMTQSAPPSSQSSTTSPLPVTKPIKAPPLMSLQSVTATAPGTNPPHGQPNHRCDIPVGAPLSSLPGTQPTPTGTSQPKVSVQASTPSTAPGMNPPHGQPNHRCDIAVGAPLNSPPGK